MTDDARKLDTPNTLEPLPCPWCGAAAEVRTNDGSGAAPWTAAWVQCSRGRGCEVGGPVVKLVKPQDAEVPAIEKWNAVCQRAADGARIAGATEGTIETAVISDDLSLRVLSVPNSAGLNFDGRRVLILAEKPEGA